MLNVFPLVLVSVQPFIVELDEHTFSDFMQFVCDHANDMLVILTHISARVAVDHISRSGFVSDAA